MTFLEGIFFFEGNFQHRTFVLKHSGTRLRRVKSYIGGTGLNAAGRSKCFGCECLSL